MQATRPTKQKEMENHPDYIMGFKGKYVRKDGDIGKQVLLLQAKGIEVKPELEAGEGINLIFSLIKAKFPSITDAILKETIAGIAEQLPATVLPAYGGKGKVIKHPDAPKPVKTAFNYFSANLHATNKVAWEGKDLAFKSKFISEAWSLIESNPVLRAGWDELNKADKERYNREVAEFNAKHPEFALNEKTEGRAAGHPKRATSLSVFKTEMKKGDIGHSDAMIEWAALAKEEKERYEKLAAAENVGFEDRFRKFYEIHGLAALSEADQKKMLSDPTGHEVNFKTGQVIKLGKGKTAKGAKPVIAAVENLLVTVNQEDEEEVAEE